MKIALIGFGNMGKEIKHLIEITGTHQVVSISFEKETDSLDLEGIKGADLAIDFTSPAIVLENIKKVSAMGKNMVIGTTGWYDQIGEVEKMIKESGIGLIYGQNFSVGANIFFKIVEYSSALFAKFGNYDVYGYEVHHTGKKDSPSGTALRIAKAIMDNFPNKKTLQFEKIDRQIDTDELHFASIRGGRNPGYHEVVFDSGADSITLSHSAHNRSGFAQGAILAAEYIQGKKGLHNFDEIFNEG